MSELWQAIIAVCAVWGGLTFFFNLLLTPLKQNQENLGNELRKVQVKISGIESDMSDIKKLLQAKSS